MDNSTNNNQLHNTANYENKLKIFNNKLNNMINSNTITPDFF